MSTNAIFLSASIPSPKRDSKYFDTSDPIAITAAIKGLIYVTLGRRMLVWGGHPAITPIIWTASEDMKVNYGSWVHLYQSLLFDQDFPDENSRFKNVTFVPAIGKDQPASLAAMRNKMLKDFVFDAGVFIGGMEGVEEEYNLFAKAHPKAKIAPIGSTGGASLILYNQLSKPDSELLTSLDYIGIFQRQLGIAPTEKRQS